MREKVKYPKDWRLLSIASLVDDNKELFDDGDWIEAEYLTDSGIRLIQTGNIGEGTFVDKDKKKYISEQSFTKLKCKELNVGDILICRLADPAGRACILPDLGEEKMITSVDVSIYRPKLDYADRGFLVVSMGTANWFNEIRERCGGSTRTRIARSELGKIKIPLPPLPEQKAIAQVLSTADAAIHTIEKLIAQKELRKKWLMQQLLTGKKRLKGFEGEWKKLGAGEVFKSVAKKGFADEELLSATQDRGMIPRTMLEGRVTMPTTGTEGFKLVEVGDFVISLRSFQGGLEYSYYRGLVSPAYTVLKPKKPINEQFYKQYFKSYDFIGHLAIAVIGIRDGKQISYDDFCSVKIPYPRIEEQTAIAQVLKAADKEIILLKAKAEKLREQKKGLMQQLLTGKVRLKI
ncbi:MAG: restriction endonuclease subunit S [Cytophagales bacterium]